MYKMLDLTTLWRKHLHVYSQPINRMMMISSKYQMMVIFFLHNNERLKDKPMAKRNLLYREPIAKKFFNMIEITLYYVEFHTHLSTVFPNPEVDIIEKCL